MELSLWVLGKGILDNAVFGVPRSEWKGVLMVVVGQGNLRRILRVSRFQHKHL